MQKNHTHYRIENGHCLIDVAIQDINLLFSPMDPSPPTERDLDATTEQYILGALSEISATRPIKLVFHIPGEQISATDQDQFSQTIHNYFAYRAWSTQVALRRLLRVGFQSLLIGVIFLIVCILTRRFLEQHFAGWIGPVFGTGFDIIGWVAMWRPIEIFLYDWWPLALNRKSYLRLVLAPVELSPLEDTPLSTSFRRRGRTGLFRP